MTDHDYLTVNKQAWNHRTQLHLNSQFYDVAGFLAGQCSLNAPELNLLGDIRGKRLLHLQCHFGLDSLSLVRRGAIVTGVDLSDVAIAEANKLAQASGLKAEFVCDDVINYANTGQQQYDWVLATYGTICWLPDLCAWANTIAVHLKRGGKLCFVEFHPYIDVRQGYSYFNQGQPDLEQEGTYTENDDGRTTLTACWSHSLAEVVTALIAAGLSIEVLHEYPTSPYPCFDNMKQVANQHYCFADSEVEVPLVYAIVAKKT